MNKTCTKAETNAERGSALPLLALALAGVIVITVVLGALVQRADLRARAQAAADAAALAGAAEGEGAAARLASANDATVVSFSQDGNHVTVVVSIDGVTAVADAERRLIMPVE